MPTSNKWHQCNCPTQKRCMPCFTSILFAAALVLMMFTAVSTQIAIRTAETPENAPVAFKEEVTEKIQPLNKKWEAAHENLQNNINNYDKSIGSTVLAPAFTETEELFRLTEAYQDIRVPIWLPKEDRKQMETMRNTYHDAGILLWKTGRDLAEAKETPGQTLDWEQINAQLKEAEEMKKQADTLLAELSARLS